MEKQDIMLYSLDELKEYLNSIGEKRSEQNRYMNGFIRSLWNASMI